MHFSFTLKQRHQMRQNDDNEVDVFMFFTDFTIFFTPAQQLHFANFLTLLT